MLHVYSPSVCGGGNGTSALLSAQIGHLNYMAQGGKMIII